MLPNYIFETSWEVCNQVGGIYAVLSTRAASMQQHFPDHVIFVGPDLGKQSDIYFHEDPSVLSSFPAFDHPIRIGRWLVPGNPIAVLIRYDHLWERKTTSTVGLGSTLVCRATLLTATTTTRACLVMLPGK